MAFLELNSDDKQKLCQVARALSVPIRIDIVGLVFHKPMSVLEIAKELGIPPSSAGVHVRVLEEAEILGTVRKNINGTSTKICRVENHLVNIILRTSARNVNEVSSLQIPIGSYTGCGGNAPCGLISEHGFIGAEDDIRAFYLLEKAGAQLIWFAHGFLEYKLPNLLPKHKRCRQLSLSMELCSEAPGYDEGYKSDIFLTMNGVDCGYYRALGDYGSRRGIYTPEFWQNGLTQYGKLATWTINDEGIFLNATKISGTPIGSFALEDCSHIEMRLESREDSEYCGGFNLFGEKAGDFNQAILLSMEH